MFKIGDFSRLTQVTVKALRHYDRLGLLKPEQIDRTSGYRYYTAAQVPRLHRILALKDLGFSLEQVGQLLDAELSPGQMRGMLLQKGEEVRELIVSEQLRLERIEERLRQVEQGVRMNGYEVQLKSIPAQRVASISAVLHDHRAIGALYGELRAYQQRHGLHATAWTSLWYDGEYRETAIQAEATFNTVEPLPPHARIRVSELPAVATMACTQHQGQISGVSAAHEALLGWLAESGYHLVGPNRVLALHVTGPEAPDSLIELQYPVARDAG